jgi:hypothetical protein
MGPRPLRPSGLPARLDRLLPLDWRIDSGKDAVVIRSILVYAESQLRLSRMFLARRWVKKPPVYAAEAFGWHHGHGVDTLEERRLARRNLYVSR